MKPRNKIIFINTTAGHGSTVGELIDSLALRLEQDMGWDVLTAAGRGSADFVCGNNLTHCVNALRARLLDNDGLVDPRATRRLCRWLRSQAPDLVHIHNLHGYYIDSAILFECLRELGVHVVITMHDDWLLTGHCAVIPADCTQWHRSCYKCRHASAYPAALRASNTHQRRKQKAEMLRSLPSVTLVAPTNNLAQLVAQSHLSELPICVIPNGTSECFTQQSNESKLPVDPARLQILAVARRWHGEKNYHALEAIASTMPEGWTIKLIGQSKREHKRIQNLGIINSPEQLADFYRQSDVVICPSTNESFGLVAAEAMACGTPVVVNKLSATAENVGAEDGLAVDFSDIPSVVEAITRAARLHPATRYPLSAMATAHASLYRTLLP